MSLSKKNAPKTNDPIVDRAFDQIYDDRNDIIDSVNSNIVSVQETFTGKTGDIRVSKISENKYRLEAKSEEGWIRPGGTDTEIVDIAASPSNEELATKVNEIIEQLENVTFRLVKKRE